MSSFSDRKMRRDLAAWFAENEARREAEAMRRSAAVGENLLASAHQAKIELLRVVDEDDQPRTVLAFEIAGAIATPEDAQREVGHD